MVIINKIDEFMKRRDLSADELSELAELTTMTISNARRGKGLTLRTAIKIAQALKASVDEIFYVQEETAA